MSLSKHLDRLHSAADYVSAGKPKVRWGQLIRQNATLAAQEQNLAAAGSLVTLEELGQIRGGVVTRANAYFLLRELPFDEIPTRLRVTRGDLARIAVVADGLNYLSKIEREFLKSIIKGPESLESAFVVKRSDLRLLDVRADKKTLRARPANGALAYLRRGEIFNYTMSEDDLKGGIPAQRSQIKNRKPHWYSLQGEQRACARIVFPEHIDKRYVFTFVNQDDSSVVIDKLYLFEPTEENGAQIIHAALNSLYTWYQIELRGRSQLGEGVLELKIPDYGGLLVVNPGHLGTKDRRLLLDDFAALPNPGSLQSLQELGSPARFAYDLRYLELCGFTEPEKTLVHMEQELRALAGERIERRLSVVDAKVSRRKLTNVAASIDAYATRLAGSLEPHPDPHTFMPDGSQTETIPVLAEVGGAMEIGTELFNQGGVYASGVCVARTGNNLAAQFVRGVLLVQPDAAQINVPTKADLERTVAEWTRESRRWHERFKTATELVLVGIEDLRARKAIEQRALRLLHAI